MSEYSNQRAFKAAQARYDAMEPPDDDGPEPEDVDEEFHVWVCPECKQAWGVDDSEYTMVLGDDTFCTECLVDGTHPQCELEVDMDKLNKHMSQLRGEAIAEYGEAHVRRCERRN